jgi:MFS family permease
VLMSVEHAPRGKRGFFGGFVALGLPAGIILSNLVFLLASLAVTPEQFAAWAWRLPFLASAALVVVGLYVRLGVAESPVFAKVLHARTARRMPLVDLLKTSRRTVLLAAGSYLIISTLGYIAIVYFVAYATRELGVPLTTTLAVVIIASACAAVSILACATWSDAFGRRRFMRWGMGGLVLWSLIFFPLIDTRSVPLMTLSLAGMLTLQGAYLGPQPAVFSELFPTETRYSGSSLSLTLATIFGGAVAPFIATALYGLTGSSWPVTAYVSVVAVLSWLCVMGFEETYQRDL